MDPESEAPAPTKKLRARKPLTAEELCTRGYARLDRHRKADARADFLQATTLDPQYELAWVGLALAAADETMQRDSLRKVLEINPENEQARGWLEQLDRLQEIRSRPPLAAIQPVVQSRPTQASATYYRPPTPPSSQGPSGKAMMIIAGGLLLLIIGMFWSMGVSRSLTPTPIPYSAPRATVRAVPTSGPVRRTGAVCNDGSISSATGSGACSRHDGVDHWLYSK